jgi:hypothetical protein
MAMNDGMQAPDIQAKISVSHRGEAGSPADFAAFIAAQHRKWTEVGKAGREDRLSGRPRAEFPF